METYILVGKFFSKESPMKTIHKFISIFSLIAILALAFATPAQAFDGRSGDKVVIGKGEVIEDDVYVTANQFVLDGTVKGDLIVFGQTITINGTVEGDLIAAGQSVQVNGTVTDDARIAGAALQLGEKASIGGDVVAGGASFETKENSAIDGELVVGAGQALTAGSVTGDASFGVGALELRGEFGGNVKAEVGEPAEGGGPPMSMFMTDVPFTMPSVAPGFTITEDAKIKGNLEYTQRKDIKIPSNVVGGKVTRKEPVVNEDEVVVPPTPTETALNWVFDLFRAIVTLILLGLLLGWLAPMFIKTLAEKMQTNAGASLGWGVVAFAAFFFAIFIVVVVMIIGGILFGTLTLGSLSGTIIVVSLLAIFTLIVGFVLVTAFLAKIVVSWLGGKLILARISPALAESKIWPLVLGVVIVTLLTALPGIGWLFGLVVTFLGLGALWLWGREIMQTRKVTP